jgi:MOSC domain-containing protein YiiM
MTPHITNLYITTAKSQPMLDVPRVEAVTGRGLVGDRYYLGTGYYSGKPGWGANVSLLAAEAIDAINAGHDQHFTGAMLRRNIVTRGIDVETLIGREFQLGTAILRGLKRYPPCRHLAELCGAPELIRYLAYCGGIGAEVVESGVLALGDEVLIKA